MVGGNIDSGRKVPIIEALRDITSTSSTGRGSAWSGTTAPASRRCCGCWPASTSPPAAARTIRGRVAPVFDLGVGMDPEISGYENIIIRGLFLGMTRKQMEDRIDDIADFTELGDFLSMPLRTYSTGMRIRLALGVVTSIDPEILLLDEGIGAVDAAFLEKAQRAAGRPRRPGRAPRLRLALGRVPPAAVRQRHLDRARAGARRRASWSTCCAPTTAEVRPARPAPPTAAS